MPKEYLVYGEPLMPGNVRVAAEDAAFLKSEAQRLRLPVADVARECLWDAFWERVPVVGPIANARARARGQRDQISCSLPKALNDLLEDLAEDFRVNPNDVACFIFEQARLSATL